MPPQLMTVAQYAEHRGVSDSYIRRMRRGGSLVLSDGELIVVQASDELLDGLTNPVRGGPRPGSGRPARGDSNSPARADRDPSTAAAADPAPEPPPAAGSSFAESLVTLPASISVQEAVRRERLARARLAELELGEQAGQLMRVDTVNRVVFTLVRQALNQLQGMNARLAKTLAAETDAFRVGVLLDVEVANICQEMRAATVKLLEGGETAGAAEHDDADADADADAETTEAAGQ